MERVICPIIYSCPVSDSCQHTKPHVQSEVETHCGSCYRGVLCVALTDDVMIAKIQAVRTAVVLGRFIGVEEMRRTFVIFLDQIEQLAKEVKSAEVKKA